MKKSHHVLLHVVELVAFVGAAGAAGWYWYQNRQLLSAQTTATAADTSTS